ncbi:MAG TPA: hypothetical protein VK177_19860 [Flavobacteriales bacterium]|nr:hypothetical protein [Flavobacteriales bacterium]
MRFCLAGSFVCSLFLGKTQSFEEIRSRLANLYDSSTFVCDSTGFSKLPNVNYFCSKGNEVEGNFYHVTDLNNDGLNDLIYNGPCMPYSQTAIFLNNGKTLNMIYDQAGTLQKITRTKNGTFVDILLESIACLEDNSITRLVIGKKGLVADNTISFHHTTTISTGQLKQINVGGTLRTTPAIDNADRVSNCIDEIVKGNQVMQLKNNSVVTELARQGAWSLVLYSLNKHSSLIGWIKTGN